jgi:hypothetical protein
MKERFPGYFPISDEGSKAAWNSGLFSFDASVLLDLYRYSDETRQELVKLLKSLGDRIWITHQAGQEFLDGRLAVIASQAKRYEENVASLNALESTYKSARGHPFLTKQLLTDCEALFKKLRAYLNGKKSQLDQLGSTDPIQEEIVELLKGRVGEPFTDENSKEIFAEGERRYAAKVPPGYEDAKKPNGSSRFGDLIIWFQLIEKGGKEKKPITFITADGKEDWWRIWQGKTVGPRPELIAEMVSKAGITFQMFSLERFMEVASEKLSRVVKEAAIREVKEVRKAELSPGAMQILRTLGQERLNVQSGLTGATGPMSAYHQLVADQERLNAQLGLTGATGPMSVYHQLVADQERLNAQLGLTGATGPMSAYHQMMADQERLNAALGTNLAPTEPTASPKKKTDEN